MCLSLQEDPGEGRKEERISYRNLMMSEGQREKGSILRQKA